MPAMHTVRSLMTPDPVCAQASDSLASVARMMARADTGFIPILEGDIPVGVLTDRDLVVRALAEGRDPQTTRASEICSYHLFSVMVDETLDTAISRMAHRQVRRLLVLENGSRLVGVISLGDLAQALPAQAETVLEEVSRSAKTAAHRSPLA